MLKSKKAKIVNCTDKQKKEISQCLKRFDDIYYSTLNQEFKMIYLDTKKYTIEEIAEKTGNSRETIRRHLRLFNNLLEKNK